MDAEKYHLKKIEHHQEWLKATRAVKALRPVINRMMKNGISIREWCKRHKVDYPTMMHHVAGRRPINPKAAERLLATFRKHGKTRG